jgi:hypothetical protein
MIEDTIPSSSDRNAVSKAQCLVSNKCHAVSEHEFERNTKPAGSAKRRPLDKLGISRAATELVIPSRDDDWVLSESNLWDHIACQTETVHFSCRGGLISLSPVKNCF